MDRNKKEIPQGSEFPMNRPWGERRGSKNPQKGGRDFLEARNSWSAQEI